VLFGMIKFKNYPIRADQLAVLSGVPFYGYRNQFL